MARLSPGRQAIFFLKTVMNSQSLEGWKNFLVENGGKEGVVTLPSGLRYRVLKPGEGAIPGPDDNVKAHYVGRFTLETSPLSSRFEG